MVNNLELVKPLLKFESEDDFYFIQVLQRKKENPHIGSNSRVIKEYFVGSIEYLESRFEEMKTLSSVFNARVVINLNKRSYYKTAFKSMENVAGIMANKHFNKIHRAYSSACGQGHNDSNKKWILDIDEEFDFDWWYNLNERIEDLGGKTIVRIPTKNGCHLITTPFRLDIFKQEYPNIDVHKNNPTILYISSNEK